MKIEIIRLPAVSGPHPPFPPFPAVNNSCWPLRLGVREIHVCPLPLSVFIRKAHEWACLVLLCSHPWLIFAFCALLSVQVTHSREDFLCKRRSGRTIEIRMNGGIPVPMILPRHDSANTLRSLSYPLLNSCPLVSIRGFPAVSRVQYGQL